jgi:hypothetical protein
MMTQAVFDLTTLRAVCGDLPYDAQDGVQITVDWLKQVAAMDLSV